MSDRSSLSVVQLTPPGRGAVATLLIEGPAAAETVASCVRTQSGRSLLAFAPDRLVFGRFGLSSPLDSDAPGEEVVVRLRSPESVEIHCHGGAAAVQLVQQAFVDRGGQVVAWEDWLRGHEPDAIAQAARRALAHARTERTAKILLDQYQGALGRALESLCVALTENNTRLAAEKLDELLAHALTGLHLVEPWRVVLAGPPNVGKSSLINALLGYERAIVHPRAGTTRDVVTSFTALDGWPVELSDTAGLRRDAERVEQAGIALAQERLTTTDLVVLVFDQSEPWSSAEERLVSAWPAAIVVHNKIDLTRSPGGVRPAGIATSARSGEGLPELVSAIVDRLVPSPPPAGAAVPFTRDQVASLHALRVRHCLPHSTQ